MNNRRYFLLIVLLCAIAYSSYLYLRPVNIIGVHPLSPAPDDQWVIVVVNHFPITQSGKIRWWKKNRSKLKTNYHVPHPDKDGYFHLTFMDIGSGYREDSGTDQDSYLLCFDDMDTRNNCIEKKPVFAVTMSRNGVIKYH